MTEIDTAILLVIVIASAGIGFAVGVYTMSDEGPERVSETQASVTCSTFLTENGTPNGICFISGDVKFEWLGGNDTRFYGKNSTNGTLTLTELPANNSTVRTER